MHFFRVVDGPGVHEHSVAMGPFDKGGCKDRHVAKRDGDLKRIAAKCRARNTAGAKRVPERLCRSG